MDSLKQEIEIGLERLNEHGLREALHQINMLQQIPRLQNNHNALRYMATGEYLNHLELSEDRLNLLMDFAVALKNLSQEKVDELNAERKTRKTQK